MSTQQPLYVTRPHLPDLQAFMPYLQEIWQRRVLTNGGPFHAELEARLCEYLQVPHLSLFSNGTLALVTALQALDIKGEVITTPYSFVATAHALLWNGLKPVFVDIDPHTFNLDPAQVEAAIGPHTTAILPVHVYGHPCDTRALAAMAKAHGLRLIYDAAHAFGVRQAEGSLLAAGDLSVLSFHATKVFNTFEGGAIICPDAATKRHIDQLKNFGFVDETTVIAPGINGKMNEFCAALGLAQLQEIDALIERRAQVDARYRQALAAVPGISCPALPAVQRHNYAYFPILVGPDYPLSRDALYERLKAHGVYARRYFYPLISHFPMYRDLPSAQPARLPVAQRVASQVICLPLYPDLSAQDQDRVLALIARPV